MTQHYFSEWYDAYETTDLKPLRQAIAQRDKASLQTISEQLFESYLDITAALPYAEVAQYAECLDICFYCYFINPEVFRLFVKRANQRRATESTKEWQESDEYFLITYQFRYAFG